MALALPPFALLALIALAAAVAAAFSAVNVATRLSTLLLSVVVAVVVGVAGVKGVRAPGSVDPNVVGVDAATSDAIAAADAVVVVGVDTLAVSRFVLAVGGGGVAGAGDCNCC